MAYPGSSELLWGGRSTQTEPAASLFSPTSLGRAAHPLTQKHFNSPQNMNHLQSNCAGSQLSQALRISSLPGHPKAAELSPAGLCPVVSVLLGMSSSGFSLLFPAGHSLFSLSSPFCAADTRTLLLKLFPSQISFTKFCLTTAAKHKTLT